jgi:2-amino-4-hydroxy-6-hydroxymethyldihydropteridine diphosphokinase
MNLLEKRGVKIARCSRFFRSAPVPPSDQPWFVNAVAAVDTDLSAGDLLALLHDIEAELGRTRRQRWEARVIDLDLLDYRSIVTGDSPPQGEPVLPHPRLAERAFVLLPLKDVAPDWRHPVSHRSVDDLISGLHGDQMVIPLSDHEVEE